MMEDPYKILGVSPNASDDEIKQAYRRLAKQYHPDRNPGDAEAARKMQQINDAYEQIKNPGNRHGGYSNPFGGQQSYGSQGDSALQAAEHYIRFHRYREALNALSGATQRTARWYYLSALANHGIGNQVTAMEHIRRAVSMEPNNGEYLRVLDAMENGGAAYRQQAGQYRGFDVGAIPCHPMCLCWLLDCCCIPGGCC